MSLKTSLDKIRKFHTAFGHPCPKAPDLGDQRLKDLRVNLIQEELNELKEALTNNDPIKALDAYADLMVVVFGGGVSMGLPLEAGYDEVMRSNMTKLGADGKPIIREDGKILKGPNYEPPDLGKVLYGGIAKEKISEATAG